jgi:inhibitor of cysteine peptidase
MRSSERWRVELIAIAIVLLSVWSAGCPHKAVTITADKNYDGRTTRLGVGDTVKLSLAENPTTGYRWEILAKAEPACVVVSDAYVANPAMNQIGGGGAHEWEIRAVKKGTGTLKLGYRRPWEKDAARTFTLVMVVK